VLAHPETKQALLEILASRLRQADEELAAARVARALLELAEFVGKPSGPQCLVLDEKISHADLAAMAGVARENASRVLSEWRRRKLVLTGTSPRFVLWGHRRLCGRTRCGMNCSFCARAGATKRWRQQEPMRRLHKFLARHTSSNQWTQLQRHISSQTRTKARAVWMALFMDAKLKPMWTNRQRLSAGWKFLLRCVGYLTNSNAMPCQDVG